MIKNLSILRYYPFLIGFFMLFFQIGLAQKRCATTSSNNEIIFENWLENKINTKQNKNSRADEEIYRIPVVVHIIHQGEAIGTGTNISKEQILSQIRILNEDFRRIPQTPGFNNNPEGADTRIEFSLAIRNPQGENTEGIVRLEGNKEVWNISDEVRLKSLSYWDSEEYLNIWVCDLNGFLGYATFPESDLGGLSDDVQNPNLDGVVVDYQAFGDIGTAKAPFHFGRTATHEIGHYLGLRHIWGDVENCLGNDYCDDTPPASKPNRGCPEQGRTVCSEIPEMFQNYLDYTDDACMRVFTKDQKTRMRTVLENSPRRKSLLVSRGLAPQIVGEHNAGIDRLFPLQNTFCQNIFFPNITLRNYGQKNLQNLKITYGIEGVLIQQQLWTGNLSSLETQDIILEEITLDEGVEYIFFVEVSSPNQKEDAQKGNNRREQKIIVKVTEELPLKTDFETNDWQTQWEIQNIDNKLTWQLTDTLNQQMLQFPAFDYIGNNNEDWFISPVLENALNDGQELYLSFDIAYAPFKVNENSPTIEDGLKILVSKDCGKTFTKTIFEAYAESLATAPTTQEEWFPSSRKDWKRIRISLEEVQDEANLNLAFVGVSNFGNHIFLDNISIEYLPKAKNKVPITNLYPNPTQDIFWLDIRFEEAIPLEIRVLDAQGKLYQEFKLSSQKEFLTPLDFSNYPKGIYYIHIINNEATIQKRVMIY